MTKTIQCTLPILQAMRAALDEGMDPREVHEALALATASLLKREEPNFGAEGHIERMLELNSRLVRSMIEVMRDGGRDNLNDVLRRNGVHWAK